MRDMTLVELLETSAVGSTTVHVIMSWGSTCLNRNALFENRTACHMHQCQLHRTRLYMKWSPHTTGFHTKLTCWYLAMLCSFSVMLSTGRENWSMEMPSTASEEFSGKICLGITKVTLLPATGECYFLDYVIDRNGSCGDNIKEMGEAGQNQNDQRE